MSNTYRRLPTERTEGTLPEPAEVWTYEDQAEADLAWQQRAWSNRGREPEFTNFSTVELDRLDHTLHQFRTHLTVIRGGRAGS